jgi:hypothetical protein
MFKNRRSFDSCNRARRCGGYGALWQLDQLTDQ